MAKMSIKYSKFRSVFLFLFHLFFIDFYSSKVYDFNKLFKAEGYYGAN